MSYLLTIIVSLSLVGAGGLSIYWLKRDRNWRRFFLHITALLVYFVVLMSLFDFPTHLTARGQDNYEPYMIVALYLAMLLGMIAQYSYSRLSRPKRYRKKFDFGVLIAPVFMSPIVFIPIVAAFQHANVDFALMSAPRIMTFLVAFENGFFWREFFENRIR